MRSFRVLALDVGASRLTGAVLTGGSRGPLQLEDLAGEPIDGGSAAEPPWMDALARAARALAIRMRYQGEVRIAIPGHLAFTKCVRTPAIAGARRRRVVEFEATQNIPHALDQVWWDHTVIDPAAAELDVLLMATRRSAMSALCAAVAIPGWRLETARPVAAALHGAVRLGDPDIAGPVLLTNIGARSTHLLVCGADQLWLRTVALGGEFVTQTIAAERGLDFAAAEALKRTAGSVAAAGRAVASADQAAVASASAQFNRRLQLEIARTLTGLAEHRPGGRVQRLYLLGGGSRLAGLDEFLRGQLALPVERFDPWRRVRNAAPGAVSPDDESGLAVAVGLTADLVDVRARGGNLLPPAVRRRVARRRDRRVWLAAAALGIAALLPPTWHYHQAARAVEAECDAREAQLKAARAVAERNAVKAAQLEQVRAELATLADWSAARGYWLAFFADLQARLGEVEDVWFDELAIMEKGREEAGGAPAAAPGARDDALQLIVRGRLLAGPRTDGQSNEAGHARAKILLARLASSPFVAAIGEERFDNAQPGVLRFSCRLSTKRPG